MFVYEQGATIAEAKAMVGGVLEGFDPDAVPDFEVVSLWECFDAISRLGEAGKTLLARRVDDCRQWHRSGYRNPADFLAAKSGTSPGKVRRELDTSKRLRDHDEVREAFTKGDLSGEQAELIADAADANPAAAATLVDKAAKGSLRQLRDDCGRAKAARDTDAEAANRRIHARRCWRTWRDREGAWNATVRGTVADGSRIEQAIERLARQLLDAARREDRRDPHEAYAFDALVALADHSRGGGDDEDDRRSASGQPNLRYLVLLRLDLEALRRGYVQGDELCEITGIGPIPVRVARELLGESVLKLVLTKGVDVAHVTHLGRGPSVAQETAILWRHALCINQACNKRWTQVDHRHDWTDVKVTELANLDAYCGHDHYLKTHKGWALVEGTGRRPFVPPDDPRHPGHHKKPRAGPAP